MAVNPQDIYSIVADPAMSPDDKRARINMLYAPPAIAMPGAMPDVRTAAGDPGDLAAISGAMGDPSLSRPQAPQQVIPGGNFGISTAPQAIASAPVDLSHLASPDLRAASVESAKLHAPLMPAGAFSPELQASATAHPVIPKSPATAPVGAHASDGHAQAAPVAPDSRSDQDMLDAGAQAVIGAAFRGGAAHRIAAHDQPTASVIERVAGIPEEDKERLATDAQANAGLALNEGDQAAESHDAAAKLYGRQAVNATADKTELELKNQFDQDHVAEMDKHYEQLVKDTAVAPNSWWTSKDVGHQILAVISATMFGLARDTGGLQKIIDADMERRQSLRKDKLGAARQSLESFKSRLLSPEAQHAAERALSAQAVSAEANRLAEAAASPEAKLKAQQVAQQFQTQHDQWAAEMAAKEAGSIRTNIAHVPDRVVGGAPDPIARIKQLKEAGLSPEEILRVIGGGKYNGAAPAEEGKTRIILPDGSVGYSSEDLHAETQKQMDALSGLQGNLNRIKELSKSAGHTIGGQDKARLKAVVADTTMQLSAMARGEGAQARMAGEMLEKLGPLTGSTALETGTLDSTARAGIDEASRIYGAHVEGIKGRLTPSATTRPSGGKIQTLGVAPDDVGAKPSE